MFKNRSVIRYTRSTTYNMIIGVGYSQFCMELNIFVFISNISFLLDDDYMKFYQS